MLLLAMAMIAITITIAVAVLLDAREREITHSRGEIVSLTRILAEQTTRTVEGVALMMRNTQERLSDDIGQKLELHSGPVQWLLSNRVAGLPQVKSLFVVNRNGLGVNSSRPDFLRNLNMSERPFFNHYVNGASDELFVSLPEKARVDGQWTFYVSTRLLDSEGEFRGVLVAAINIDYFESLYASISLDFVDKIILLDNEGMLLAGKPHAEGNFGQSGIDPAALRDIRNNRDWTTVITMEGDTGKQFIAYRQISKYPLMVGAAVNEQDALTPWRRIAQPIITGVALVILFVLASTFFAVRTLLRQEHLESELKDSDEQLRHMVQSVRDAIVTVDADQRVVLFNHAAERMFGIPGTDVIGRQIDEWLARCGHPPEGNELQRYLQEGVHSSSGLALLGIIELRGTSQNFPVELSLSTTTVHGRILTTAIFRDLAERQRAENELLASNRQLKELSASLQNVREQERARISREMHDELGQLLTGMRMEVSWLGGKLSPEQKILAGKIDSIKGMIDQTIVSVRRISSELRPLVLDDLGFSAAAGWYVDQFSARTGLRTTLDLPTDNPRLDDASATAMFRVLQESLTNVARHAGATRVDIGLTMRDGEWVLSIRDDGTGIATDAVGREGIGLIGMRERIQMLGGRFSVLSPPGGGTEVEAIVPATTLREGDDGKI